LSRYFIANVMQTHSTGQSQSTFNPFSRPEVLATLVIPQIEAYLATNPNTSLLILYYPFNHLATVLALQKLLGQDLLKIAGIVDSLSNDATSPKHNQGPPRAHHDSGSQRRSSIGSHISSLNTGTHQNKNSESGVSFSKANYLLPSTATDAEITTFLSKIRMSLMEKSAFYTPEPEPKPISPVASITQRDSSHPPVLYHGSQGRESRVVRLTGTTRPRAPPTGGREKHRKYAASIASTVRTTDGERGRREDAGIEKDWENFYIGDEDSDDDDYDRMVLGSAMAKIVPEMRKVPLDGKAPKRSTKKALKWLGLA
jgi:hypothetical protein